MTKKSTQCDKIIHYMETYGSITPLDALREYGVMRLASRINNLKNRGYNIETVIEKSTNRDGDTVRYARYFIKNETLPPKGTLFVAGYKGRELVGRFNEEPSKIASRPITEAELEEMHKIISQKIDDLFDKKEKNK